MLSKCTITDYGYEALPLKRYNFQIRNKMNKENETLRTTRHGNDFIADVGGSTFSVNKTYPKAKHWDRYSADTTFVSFEISTNEPLPTEFDAELMKLVAKYCR